MMIARLLILLLVVALPRQAMAQALTTAPKGTTARGFPTSTDVNTNRQALDVWIQGTTGSGSGTSTTDNSTFTGGTTPVTPAGAIYDTSPPAIADGNVGAFRMDSNRILMVNCQSGCAGAAGDGTATGALGALNAAVTIALSTYQGADINFTAGGSLSGTVVAEGSNDGGTTWFSAVFSDPTTGTVSASLASPTSGNYVIVYPGSLSHVRARVSVYTSGSTTANLRTTATQPYAFMYGSDGTNLRPVALDTTGHVRTIEKRSATATRTQVANSLVDGLILAANASRNGATIFNDSTGTLFLGFGSAAVTTTNYTVRIGTQGNYELPSNFTGELRGLWDLAPGGGAKVTEMTP